MYQIKVQKLLKVVNEDIESIKKHTYFGENATLYYNRVIDIITEFGNTTFRNNQKKVILDVYNKIEELLCALSNYFDQTKQTDNINLYELDYKIARIKEIICGLSITMDDIKKYIDTIYPENFHASEKIEEYKDNPEDNSEDVHYRVLGYNIDDIVDYSSAIQAFKRIHYYLDKEILKVTKMNGGFDSNLSYFADNSVPQFQEYLKKLKTPKN